MKVLYDHQVFEWQKFGGISRYFYELLHQYHESRLVEWSLSLQFSENEYLQQFDPLQGKISEQPPPPVARNHYQAFFWGKHFKGKYQLYKLKKRFFPNPPPPAPGPNRYEVNRQLSVRALEQGDFDIFHPTYFEDYFLPHLGRKPFVLTVYDMVYEMYPEYFPHQGNISVRKKELAQRASHILSISESTKQDLVRFFGIDPAKITVVYLANSLEKPADLGQVAWEGLPERYLLYVGNRTVYKNFYFFVRAILPLLEEDPGLHLVCTGPAFGEDEQYFFRNLGVLDRVRHYFVDDAKLAYLYSRALAFVFPSLFEGFGLPVLEAFSCDCPAVISNTTSLPEVGGEAAEYFEPKNEQSIRKAITGVIYDPHHRRRLVEKGRTQLKKFSWEKTAEETAAVYRKLV